MYLPLGIILGKSVHTAATGADLGGSSKCSGGLWHSVL